MVYLPFRQARVLWLAVDLDWLLLGYGVGTVDRDSAWIGQNRMDSWYERQLDLVSCCQRYRLRIELVQGLLTRASSLGCSTPQTQ